MSHLSNLLIPQDGGFIGNFSLQDVCLFSNNYNTFPYFTYVVLYTVPLMWLGW